MSTWRTQDYCEIIFFPGMVIPALQASQGKSDFQANMNYIEPPYLKNILHPEKKSLFVFLKEYGFEGGLNGIGEAG